MNTAAPFIFCSSIKAGLLSLLLCGHTLASNIAEPIDALTGKPYTDQQYQRIARSVCLKLDRYKDNAQAYILRKPKMCTALPEACRANKTHIGPRGLTRYTIATILKIRDTESLERDLPALISKTLSFNCPKPSSHALPDLPFDQQLRNIMKRAAFVAQSDNFFRRFLFKDYEYEVDGKLRLKVDINAIEMVEGEPETILDYLDKVLAPTHDAFFGKARRDDMEDLRVMLLERGALRARALRCEPGQKIGCDAEPEYQRQAQCIAGYEHHKAKPVPENFIQSYIDYAKALYAQDDRFIVQSDETLRQDAIGKWPGHIDSLAFKQCVFAH